MAFLRPDFLVPVTFHYEGAVDNLTDAVLGYIHCDCKIFYIDYVPIDANATYDQTQITLEYDDGAAGADTQIDQFNVAAASGTRAFGQLTLDDLTNSFIPGGSRILMTAADVTTPADTGITFTFWVYITNRP